MCDRDITTNFGAVAWEVILVDSCACTVIFICYDSQKKETEFLLVAVLFITAAVLFKTDVLVELGIGFLFPEGKRRSKQD